MPKATTTQTEPLNYSLQGLGRALAIASLAVWVAIVICGRWIAYTQE